MQHAHRKIVNTTELLLTTAAKLQAPTLNEHETASLTAISTVSNAEPAA